MIAVTTKEPFDTRRCHVNEAKFAEELAAAGRAGLHVKDRPTVKRFHAALLAKETA